MARLVPSALFAVQTAHAHGVMPRTDTILFDPGDARHIVMASRDNSLFESRDGGATFAYACPPFGGNIESVAILPDGAVAVGTALGGYYTTNAGLCAFEHQPDFGDQSVSDIDVSNDGTARIVAGRAGDASTVVTRVAQSTDSLKSFDPRGEMPAGVFGDQLAVAPSDPNVMYLTAFVRPATSLILRSHDSGTTWDESAAPAIDIADGLGVAGVSPTDPDVLFLRVMHFEEAIVPVLYASFDGGASYRVVFETAGGRRWDDPLTSPITGFAFSPDGSEIVFGGPYDGVWHARVDALRTDPRAVEQLSKNRIYGLTWTADGLFAGGDEFPFMGGPPPPFTLGVSHDGGQTFAPLFRICQTTVACSDSSNGSCIQATRALSDMMTGGLCAAAPNVPSDAGLDTAAVGVAQSSGCGSCRANPAGGPTRPWVACAATATLLVVYRRRARRRARRIL